ncbi:MAG: response regulator [Collinsella sp.]
MQYFDLSEDERALCGAIASRGLRNFGVLTRRLLVTKRAGGARPAETVRPSNLRVALDLNLPRIDGMTVLRELRKTDCETKVLVLSARGEVVDKVAGLDAGASTSHLTKPNSASGRTLRRGSAGAYPQALRTKRHSINLRKAQL